MTIFRKGDRVAIEAIVEEDGFRDEEIRVRPEGFWSTGSSCYARVDRMTLIKATFQVGDEVWWSSPESGVDRGHILSIYGEHAWIDRGGGGFSTVCMTGLNRVDPAGTSTEERS